MHIALANQVLIKAGWRGWLARFGRASVDLVYPALCPACGVGTAEPGVLCGPCWAKMPFISRPYCERLGEPFSLDVGGPLLSPQAIADPPVFNRARAVALHDGDARGFVHRLKYADRLDLARPMGRMMAASGHEVLDNADILIPVPLHWTRHLWRRFNQAEVLGEEVAKRCQRPLRTDILRRRRRTQPQVGMTRAQRQANLQGAFVVADRIAEGLRGGRIVLIDDVHTTGSTLNACARVLLRAGAANVDVLTFTKVANGLNNPI